METNISLTLEGNINLNLDLIWLRDHCKCELCYDHVNSNRKLNILDIPDDISTKRYNVDNEKLNVVCKFFVLFSECLNRFLLIYFRRERWTQIRIWVKFSHQVSAVEVSRENQNLLVEQRVICSSIKNWMSVRIWRLHQQSRCAKRCLEKSSRFWRCFHWWSWAITRRHRICGYKTLSGP